MKAWAYYNEFDPFAAAWLRELIKDGLIAPGEVDERSIEDVSPNELRPFRQCHFFAGIGVWSLAARRAGFRDDEALWSGSCPCQPFSTAGKGGGVADERHLWPAFHYLLEQCRPPLVVGEQVTGADGDAWFDLVSADLDATAYAFGVAETVACGFGAPHKRSRNYWMAHRIGAGLEGYAGYGDDRDEPGRVGAVEAGSVAARGISGELADNTNRIRRTKSRSLGSGKGTSGGKASNGSLREGDGGAGNDGFATGGDAFGMADGDGDGLGTARDAGRGQSERDAQPRGAIRKLDDPLGDRRGARRDYHVEHDRDEPHSTGQHGVRTLALATDSGRERGEASSQGRVDDRQIAEREQGEHGPLGDQPSKLHRINRPGPVNGYWRDADWLRCRDEKWRPVEPGTFPLVDAGTFRNRVGLLRGAGNACTLAQAEGFLIAVRHALKLG